MPLSLEHRRVGHVAVVTCAGRLVEGTESIALRQLLDELLQFGPHVVLHVSAVEFIDSAGVGLLVRYNTRTRNKQGRLNLCAPSAKIAAVLKATRLDQVFDSYDSEAAAIAALYERAASAGGPSHLSANLLCVLESPDVQAYIREILGRNGYSAMTAGNIADALVLLQATRPKLVVVSAELAQVRGTYAAEKFRRLADGLSVIELPPDFSQRDPGDAAGLLLDRLRELGIMS
jgi:anti-sigma B factor antagonist